jgi:hypothetical protein
MTKQQSFALLELTPPRKPVEPCERCLRQKTPLTDRVSVLPEQDRTHLVPDVDVVVVVGQRERRTAQPEQRDDLLRAELHRE